MYRSLVDTALSGDSSAQMRLAHNYYLGQDLGQEVEKDIQKQSTSINGTKNLLVRVMTGL